MWWSISYNSQDGYTALMRAAGMGVLEIVSMLLDGGATIDLEDKVGVTQPLIVVL